MSATFSTRLLPAVAISARAFARRLGACCSGIARYFSHRAAIASLRELDDGALQDIGVARSQIEAAVHGFTKLRPPDA